MSNYLSKNIKELHDDYIIVDFDNGNKNVFIGNKVECFAIFYAFRIRKLCPQSVLGDVNISYAKDIIIASISSLFPLFMCYVVIWKKF